MKEFCGDPFSAAHTLDVLYILLYLIMRNVNSE